MPNELTRTQGKSTRLDQIELLLLAYPDGLTQAEIARRCGVHRSTIHRTLGDLAEVGIPIWEKEGRIGIDREAYLSAVWHFPERWMVTRQAGMATVGRVSSGVGP